MSESARFAVFLTIVLAAWTLMHVYVGSRLWRLPPLASPRGHLWLVVVGVALFLLYPLGRILDRLDLSAVAVPMELAGAHWMGVLFLLLAALLAVDVVTGFGFWDARLVAPLRLGAVGVALVLSVIATVQGLRPPAVRTLDVRLAGLPASGDGLRVVHLSDLHLGTLLGESWLAARIDQVLALQPDLVVITGDLVDSDSAHVEEMVPLLQRLRAPLGVWAVSGNHEFYAGLERSVALMKEAGYEVLRDRVAEVVPGLMLAGIDDLTARQQFGMRGDPLATTLDGRTAGATILLSHTPWRAQEAAAKGVGLMLAGHTHGGQIWPFDLLVWLRYPLVGGVYDVGGMRVVVSAGTGTWGPRMRLWRRSEIWLLTLRSSQVSQ